MTFDLFRLLRTKHPTLLEPLNKDLLLMKHCWIMGNPPTFAALVLLAIWLTFEIPLEPTAVLWAQLLVQLLQDQFQLVDLSSAAQGDLLHRDVNACQPGCTNQGAIISTAGLSRYVFGLTALLWTLRTIWTGGFYSSVTHAWAETFTTMTCLWDWSICTHAVCANLRILSKSHHGCMKWRLSIRTWHVPEHQEPGDSSLDWLTLLNSHNRWWSTSPS